MHYLFCNILISLLASSSWRPKGQIKSGMLVNSYDIRFIVWMDIGSSIAVFLVLSLVLLALFCFLTKYFHHKLKQTLEETAEIYSMVDELSVHDDLQEGLSAESEGENQIFKTPKSGQKRKLEKDEMLVEMTELRRPINVKDNDIYGASILKMKLNQEYKPLVQEPTNRSMASFKDFKPEKMNNTNRSHKSIESQQPTFRSQDPSPEKTKESPKHKESSKHKEFPKHKESPEPEQSLKASYSFITKLVCYDSQEINTLDVQVTSLCRLESGVVKQRRKVRAELIASSQLQFEDQLQIYGFDVDEFGCFKYESTVEMDGGMEVGKEYLVSGLAVSEAKVGIEIDEYIRHKFQLRGTI